MIQHLELSKKLVPHKDKKFLLAVSGGLDSMVLAQVFLHFRKHFNFQFAVSHFHHGPSQDKELLKFREKAHLFVKGFCKEQDIVFHSNFSEAEAFFENFGAELKSEDDFRQARYQYFDQLMPFFDHLVLAHHKDDQLETRLLKLLRGVGPDSFPAMGFLQGHKMRPFLEYSRQDLLNYAQEKKLDYLEDPSNSSVEPMRNWIRNHWLPELEEKWPGSSGSLARSLELLADRPGEPLNMDDFLEGESLKLFQLISLSPGQQKRVIANYMKGRGLNNYGQSHINEVVKRLDMDQKRHTFRLLGRCWIVDAGRMSVDGPA